VAAIIRFHPFDPIIKRTTVQALNRATGERLVVSKGAVEKVLATGEDGAEGGTWACEGIQAIRGPVMDADARLSRKGYKTLGVVS
jgi:magnesium-transporting ATPase (P-type)